MSRVRFWFGAVITAATVGALLLSPVGHPSVLANESEIAEDQHVSDLDNVEAQLEVYVEVDALEAAVELIGLAQSELTEEVLAESTPPEWPVISGFVLNLLEGAEGENFDEQYALPTVAYGAGAIAYVEQIAGVSAEALGSGDVFEAGDESVDAAETQALLHLLIVKDVLLQDAIDENALAAVGEHLEAALSFLQDADND